MRNTIVYKKVVELFDSPIPPLTVKEVIRHLKKRGLRPDKTTIYRQLEKLETVGMIKKIKILDGVLSYEKNSNHHHHFVCESCGIINDIKIKNEGRFFKKTLNFNKKFLVKSHQLEIFGICAPCQK